METTNESNEEKETTTNAAIGWGVAAAALGVAWGVSKLFSGSGESKMMKAPGRPGDFIARDRFESNPGNYFRDLRKKP